MLKARTIGRRHLYSTEQACSMLHMKLWGSAHAGLSATKATTVRNCEAKASVTTVPPADHVKTSICPAVSTMT